MTKQLFAQLDDLATEQLVGGKGKPTTDTNTAGKLRGFENDLDSDGNVVIDGDGNISESLQLEGDEPWIV